MPDTIQFKYGNQIINRYAADGRKLYTEYFTKITLLTTPIDTGAVYSYVFNRTLMTQTGTDYIGNTEYRSSTLRYLCDNPENLQIRLEKCHPLL